MTEPSFIDTPVHNVDDASPEDLLSTPFVLVRVVDLDENDIPLFKVYYGSGMGKEDVPFVAEMLHEIFPVRHYEVRKPDDDPLFEDEPLPFEPAATTTGNPEGSGEPVGS